MTRNVAGGVVQRGSLVAIAMTVMNICAYGYTMIAARVLGPVSYGAFAGLMGLLLVVGVVMLGLQATAARRIAAEPAHVAEIERSILRVGYRAGLGVALLCLVLAPVIDTALRLNSLATAALVGLTALPMTVSGAQYGVLQGERRWRALAVGYVLQGLPRIVIGTALILAWPMEAMAMVGVAVSFVVPVVVMWVLLRRPRTLSRWSGEHGTRTVLAETVHNSHALLAFLALSNVDILVARHVLDSHSAGLYASGTIAAKAVLFLPQFVVILAFPALSAASARARALFGSLGLVAVLGLLAAVAAWLLSRLALVFVGGHQYEAVRTYLWQFALLGTVVSLLQVLVYAVLARQAHRSVYLIWAALAVVVVMGQRATSFAGLLHLVLNVDGVLALALLLTSVVSLGHALPPRRGSVGRGVPTATDTDGDVERDGQFRG